MRATFFTPIFRGRSLGQAPLGVPPGPHRRAVDTDGADPRPQGAGPGSMGVGEAACQRNQTSNQTSGGSLVSWPRLPRFGSFPFRFPFRGEKGSALSAGAPRGPGERRRHWAVFRQPPSSKKSSRPRRSGPKVPSGHHARWLRAASRAPPFFFFIDLGPNNL